MKPDPYRRVAGFYDSLFQPMNAGLIAIGLKMYPPREGMVVLDVGCGTGIQLQKYLQAGCLAHGIDTSPANLDVAWQKLGEDADLRLVSGEEMPFDESTFDLVTTTLTLHEMRPESRMAVLREAERVLKSDGRLLIIDFHPGPYRPGRGWLTKAFITLSEIGAGREHFRNYRQFMAAKGIPPLVDEQGWRVEKQRVVSDGCMGMYLACH